MATQRIEQHVPQAETYDAPHRPAWQFHMGGGAIVALIGFALMLTGALAVLVMGVRTRNRSLEDSTAEELAHGKAA